MPNPTPQISLRSEEVQEILTAIPNWMIRWGNTLVLCLLLLLFGISWMIKYPDIISSEAIITTPKPPQKTFAKTSGSIETLLVSDGQLVTAHQALAIIENTANYKDVFFLKAMLDSIHFNKNHFAFPIDQLPPMTLGNIETDFALFENSYDQYLLNKQLQPFANEVLSHQHSLTELNRRLQNLQAQQVLNTSELHLKQQELERSKLLLESGSISKQSYENKQLEHLQITRNLKNNELTISQIKETIGSTNFSSKKTQISQTKEEKVLQRNLIQSFKQLKKAIKDWELAYLIKSGIEGKVSFLAIRSENQSVNTGDLMFTILPQPTSNYLARLKTPAQNAGKIKLGQKVHIKLQHYPDSEFGTIQGQIKSISLMTDEAGFYLVEVALPAGLKTSYNKDIEFRQEMPGTAEIITEDLRLIDRFFYQLKRAFRK